VDLLDCSTVNPSSGGAQAVRNRVVDSVGDPSAAAAGDDQARRVTPMPTQSAAGPSKLSPYRPAIHISDFSTATARRFRQCGAHRHIAGERKKGVAVVQQLRRWFVDQGGEPVESGDRLAAARDDDVEMSVDEMPSDAGMSNVEYAVGTVVAAA